MADEAIPRELYSREEVGAAIRTLRRARNLSVARLARLAAIDRAALAAYERGERWARFPSYDKILGAMNVEWDEFGTALKLLRAEGRTSRQGP